MNDALGRDDSDEP